jgi:deoxyguanosine kinase
MIIAIEGCIGSGKSTTAKILSKRLGSGLLLGLPLSSMFLHEFYSDPDLMALETELGFLLVHYHQIRTLRGDSLTIADFAIARDILFAKLNLQGEEFGVFDALYRYLVGRLDSPKLTIYLRVPIDELLERIRARGRLYELSMTTDYLRSVVEIYEANLAEFGAQVPIVNILPGMTEEDVADAVQAIIEETGLLS